jgi:pectinesterase
MQFRKFSLFYTCLLSLLCSCDSEAQSPTKTPAPVTEVTPVVLVVAKDGSGNFTSVQEAITYADVSSGKKVTINIKNGVYKEKVTVPAHKAGLKLVGESAEQTVITYDDYSGKGDINTFTSWTFKILANDFSAENITFENSSGPVGQAVALHIESDRAVFKNCRFIGNQDTMFADGEKSRQFFDNCYIEGTTDFIFGSATAVFRNCHIHSKKESYVTAASTTQGKAFGYVFLNNKLTANSGINKVYLGRPWRNYAKTVFISSELGAHIRPEGWHNWSKPEAEQTVLYAEYKSTGPGASPSTRVAWSKQLTDEEVKVYTVENILKGTDNWNPNEGN